MATIDSVKLPDNSTYDLTDNYSGYQTETLAMPLTINGTQETTVEGALGGLNDYGDALADNLAANENVLGAKNLNSYPYYGNKVENGITWTVNPDGSVTVSGIATGTAYIELHNRLPHIPNACILKAGTYILTGGLSSKVSINIDQRDSGGSYTLIGVDTGSGLTFTIVSDAEFPNAARIGLTLVVESGTDLSTPVTIYPMIRDSRVIDPTFVPFAETNLQLTQNKAERDDLSTIHATGSTNTTGAQINAGTFFYLNGQFCKALTNIGVNDAFTLNTNFKVDTVASELTTVESWSIAPENYAYSTEVFEFHRVGKVVYFKGCNLSDTLPAGSSTIIASLPAKLIPITTWAMRGMLDPLNPSDHYAINISSNGSVEAYRYTANSANTVGAFSQSGSYIANN